MSFRDFRNGLPVFLCDEVLQFAVALAWKLYSMSVIVSGLMSIYGTVVALTLIWHPRTTHYALHGTWVLPIIGAYFVLNALVLLYRHIARLGQRGGWQRRSLWED